MKTSFLAALCLALPLAAFAQYRQGLTTLGGSAFVDANFSGDNERWGFGVAPSIAYSYTDNSQIGLSLGTGLNFYSGNFSTDDYNFSISPFWRYNHGLGERFGVYGKIAPGLSYSRASDPSDQYWGLQANADAGAYWFFTPHVSVEASLARFEYGVSILNPEEGPAFTRQGFTLVASSSVSLSAYYHF